MAKKSASLPISSQVDTQLLRSIDIKSPEFKELLIRLWQTVNEISLVTNMKDTGYYTETEFINSQVYFPDPLLTAADNTVPVYRPVYRKVINFGALPNNAVKSVAHGITFTDTTIFTRIYGAASDKTAGRNYLPIPHSSPTLADNILLLADDTHVQIRTGSNRTAFTECYVVLEFLKY